MAKESETGGRNRWPLRAAKAVARLFGTWYQAFVAHTIVSLLLLLPIPILIAVGLRIWKPQKVLVIAPFEIPSSSATPLRISGATLAALLRDEIQRIEDEARRFHLSHQLAADSLASNDEIPDVSVDDFDDRVNAGLEISGISINLLVREWQRLRTLEESISGDLFFVEEGFNLRGSLRGVDAAGAGQVLVGPYPPNNQGVRTAIRELAARMLGSYRPGIAALYHHGRISLPDCPQGRILDKQYFTICHSGERRIPSWVAYSLTTELVAGSTERLSDFRPDPELPESERSELSDYRGSGYDRGHLASPSSFRLSARTRSATNLLSNIAPQAPRLNRGLWTDLENQIRDLTTESGHVEQVVTSILFLDSPGNATKPRAFLKDRVAVPTHFYKTILVRSGVDRARHMYAFVMPNAKAGLSGATQDYQVTVHYIERRSGIELYSYLTDAEEIRLERQVEPWAFSSRK